MAEESDPVCWVCLDGHGDPSRGALISSGCGCRGSSGTVHLDCLVQSAQHCTGRDHPSGSSAWGCWRWRECPQCLQTFTGYAQLEMARAHWALLSSSPPENADRLEAADDLARARQGGGDSAGALVLFQETLGVRRRVLGVHPDTVRSMSNVATTHQHMQNFSLALPLFQESLDGQMAEMMLLNTAAESSGSDVDSGLYVACVAATTTTMNNIGALYRQTDEMFLARDILEEALDGKRKVLGDDDPLTLSSINNLGNCLATIGDHRQGLALLLEAATTARRVLGAAHPKSKELAADVEALRPNLASKVLALGMLTGLASRADLNGQYIAVLGFDAVTGRYHCELCGHDCDNQERAFEAGEKTIKVKPQNVWLNNGTAVLVEGLDNVPELNGRRGLIKDFDEDKGRYKVVVKDRKKPVGLRQHCCRVESTCECEPKPER